ncbi:Probable RNA-directed DNA polymerase from transposon BS [Eumeta japonica]|uniref:Probable RNA-directed DNA polymerase from transposon BS n=1 Tax=Eumeta variegata TaxID=151549 RepID=A0A4C1TB33_EUMVA|nr:Probable RNA-directed DNA polymerase from transposon BS [Eumeta japonica]
MLFYTVVKLTGRDFNACVKLLFSSRLEGGGGFRDPQARETTRPPCQLQTDYPPERHERTHSTRRLIRAGVPQGSTLSPAVLAYTNDIPRPSSSGVQLALFADDTALFTEVGIGAPDSSSLQRAIDELGQWFRKWRIEVNPDKSAAIQFKTVMTYASPVFAHAARKHYIDYRTSHISKYMKDASKRFFDIAGSHPNAFRAAVDYQPPHPTHLRPRNVLTDPPDALTAAVESLNDVNDTHD